ncbi:MAG: M56 family metallopeptidase [Planctomycetes bacterium]|nr:M56 family metallopeptidase [Planctomycetota bacterium]
MAVDVAAAWLGTFALHSACVLAAALLLDRALHGRAFGWREFALRLSLWVALASSSLQCFLLGGAPVAATWVSATTPGVAGVAVPAVAAAAPPSIAAAPAGPAGPWLVLGAVAAALLGVGRLLGCRARLRSWLASRQPERDPRVLSIAASAAAALGLARPPRLSRSARLDSPIAIGWRRPEVVLPARVHELGDDGLRALLAHELAHLRRADPLWLDGIRLLEALFPWQLLLPLARRRWQRLVEVRCDALAARHTSPAALAGCLLDVAGWLAADARPVAPVWAMAVRGSALRDRVETVLRATAAATPSPVRTTTAAAAVLAGLAIAAPGSAMPQGAATAAAAVAAARSPAAPPDAVLAEWSALAADARRLQARLARRPVGPELERLLPVLVHRLAAAEQLAARLERRLQDLDRRPR